VKTVLLTATLLVGVVGSAVAQQPAIAAGAQPSSLSGLLSAVVPEETLGNSLKISQELTKLKAAMVDLSVPDSPAFTVLGLTPEEVARPTTARKLATSLLNGVDRNGVLQTGVAIDTVPYLALAGQLVTLQARIKDEFGDVLFALVNFGRHLKIDPEKAVTNCRLAARLAGSVPNRAARWTETRAPVGTAIQRQDRRKLSMSIWAWCASSADSNFAGKTMRARAVTTSRHPATLWYG